MAHQSLLAYLAFYLCHNAGNSRQVWGRGEEQGMQGGCKESDANRIIYEENYHPGCLIAREMNMFLLKEFYPHLNFLCNIYIYVVFCNMSSTFTFF